MDPLRPKPQLISTWSPNLKDAFSDGTPFIRSMEIQAERRVASLNEIWKHSESAAGAIRELLVDWKSSPRDIFMVQWFYMPAPIDVDFLSGLREEINRLGYLCAAWEYPTPAEHADVLFVVFLPENVKDIMPNCVGMSLKEYPLFITMDNNPVLPLDEKDTRKRAAHTPYGMAILAKARARKKVDLM